MASNCRHHIAQPLGVEALANALSAAEAQCEAAGARWSEPRRRVYELIVETGEPMKAYDLLAAFGPKRARTAPATVYRALNFLLDLGLAHRIESLNSFVACSRPAGRHRAEFLVCRCCGRADELDLGIGQRAEAFALDHGFKLEALVLEVQGRCGDCAGPTARSVVL